MPARRRQSEAWWVRGIPLERGHGRSRSERPVHRYSREALRPPCLSLCTDPRLVRNSAAGKSDPRVIRRVRCDIAALVVLYVSRDDILLRRLAHPRRKGAGVALAGLNHTTQDAGRGLYAVVPGRAHVSVHTILERVDRQRVSAHAVVVDHHREGDQHPGRRLGQVSLRA